MDLNVVPCRFGVCSLFLLRCGRLSPHREWGELQFGWSTLLVLDLALYLFLARRIHCKFKDVVS